MDFLIDQHLINMDFMIIDFLKNSFLINRLLS